MERRTPKNTAPLKFVVDNARLIVYPVSDLNPETKRGLMSDTGNCVFCKIIAGAIPATKIYEDDQTLAFLDIAPFEKGHVLVVPKRHAPMLTDLPAEDLQAVIRVTQKVGACLLARLPCDGFNVFQNNGACASQTVPHVHFHVVPRHNGQPLNWTPGSYASPEEPQTIQAKLKF